MPQIKKDYDDLVYFHTEKDSGYYPSKRINNYNVPLGCYYKMENRSVALSNLVLNQLLPLVEMLETGIKTNFDEVFVHYKLEIDNEEIKGGDIYQLMHQFNDYLAKTESVDFKADLTVYCYRNMEDGDVEIWKNTSSIFSFQELWKDKNESVFPVYGIGIDKERLSLDAEFTISQKRMTINRVLFQLMTDYDLAYQKL